MNIFMMGSRIATINLISYQSARKHHRHWKNPICTDQKNANLTTNLNELLFEKVTV